jgi:hypothetical protein
VKKESDLNSIRDDVLRGIGRNVLNLQIVEWILKNLIFAGNIFISTENPEQALRKRKKDIFEKPMGPLIDEFVQSIHPESTNDIAKRNVGKNATIECSLTIEDPSFVTELEDTLGKIRKERNDLIHTKLIGFDPNSLESCRSLSKELEEQRQQIKAQYDVLISIWSALREARKELLEKIDSADIFTAKE